MILNPKKDFCDREAMRKQWLDITASTTFAAAAQTSLVLMLSKYFRSPDMGTAASVAFKLEGARDVIDIMMNLADLSETKSVAPQTQNLSWGGK